MQHKIKIINSEEGVLIVLLKKMLIFGYWPVQEFNCPNVGIRKPYQVVKALVKLYDIPQENIIYEL